MLRVLIALVIVVAPAFSETADEAFQKGLAAYQKRDFAAARDAFTAALDGGRPTARVLHNLALTHYQMNQKAFALAYWRKALAIDPNFTAARTGRKLLETRMHMRPIEGDGVSLLVRDWLERVPAFLISWAFAMGLAVSGWLALRFWAARRRAVDEDRDQPGLPWGGVASGALTLIMGVVLALKIWTGAEAHATVVAEKAEVRSLPSAQAVTLFELSAGGEVLVRRTREGWSQVQNADGATGWIKDSELVVTTEI